MSAISAVLLLGGVMLEPCLFWFGGCWLGACGLIQKKVLGFCGGVVSRWAMISIPQL